jgi:hypothetical protein
MDSMSQSQTPDLRSSFLGGGAGFGGFDPASFPLNIPPSMIPYLQAAAAAHAQDTHQYRSQPSMPLRPPSYLDGIGMHGLNGPAIGNMGRYGSNSSPLPPAFDLGFSLPSGQSPSGVGPSPTLFDAFMKGAGDNSPVPDQSSTSNPYRGNQAFSPFDWPTGSSSSSSAVGKLLLTICTLPFTHL